MCISDNYSRIEDCEIDLIKLISSDLHIPTIIVITKSYYESEFSKEIKKLCHAAKMVISVNSKEVKLKEGFTIEVRNLDKLIDYSKKIISGNDNSLIENDSDLNNFLKNDETKNSDAESLNDECKSLINKNSKKANKLENNEKIDDEKMDENEKRRKEITNNNLIKYIKIIFGIDIEIIIKKSNNYISKLMNFFRIIKTIMIRKITKLLN